MLAMLCLKATATMAAVIHFNTAEEADAALKSPLYPKLMVLVYSDGMDMPQRLFAEAEEMWRKNVTFAQTAFYAHSKLVGEIGAMPDKLPAYALLMRGLPRAVPHTGAWTAAGISNFLSYQLHDFRASSLHRSSTTFTASKLANYARQRPFKSVVFAFVTTSRQESEVAHAARTPSRSTAAALTATGADGGCQLASSGSARRTVAFCAPLAAPNTTATA